MKQTILDLDPSETVELEVYKHPAGLFLIYLVGAVIAAIFLAVPFVLPGLSPEFSEFSSSVYFTLFFVGLAVLAGLGTFIAGVVYKRNVLVVTNENLIQILYASLFNRKISQLSMEKIQDVTVTQNGIFPHLFNYGTIFIETAGETKNFGFKHAMDPNIAAKKINEVHEVFIKQYGIDVV